MDTVTAQVLIQQSTATSDREIERARQTINRIAALQSRIRQHISDQPKPVAEPANPVKLAGGIGPLEPKPSQKPVKGLFDNISPENER